ncbi:hypothetical protein QUA83_23585 [Microcoleus sp. K1-B1]
MTMIISPLMGALPARHRRPTSYFSGKSQERSRLGYRRIFVGLLSRVEAGFEIG